MARWLSLAVRGAVVLVVLLTLATATARPLAGQQAADSVTHIGAGAVPARSASTTSTASTDLPGPRVRPDFQRVEPTFAGSEASSSTAVASHTFTITTLVLVLAVIIIVLLVAD